MSPLICHCTGSICAEANGDKEDTEGNGTYVHSLHLESLTWQRLNREKKIIPALRGALGLWGPPQNN